MVSITKEEESAFTAMAIEWLELRGYLVMRSNISSRMMTVKEFRESLEVDLGPSGFFRRLKHPDCPQFEGITGDSGRLIQLRPNPKLVAFCNQAKIRNGRRMRMVTETELRNLEDHHGDDGR